MRRFLLAIATIYCSCGGGGSAPTGTGTIDGSEAIYDENLLATFEITMAPADWDAIVATPALDVFYPATLVWQGETVTDVGVRPSGNTTRIPGNPKPSIRLKFDEYIADRKWRGVKQINLDSMPREKTFLHDRVGYWLYREFGVVAPRCTNGKVVVNGVYKGVYNVEEPVRKQMLKNRWSENDGNLYEPDRVDPYLWRGTDPASYVPLPFAPETNETGGTYTDVVTLCDILNNTPAASRLAELDARILNVDGLLNYMAVDNILADYDSVNGFFGARNYFIYNRLATGKFEIIPWDPEMAFGGIGGLLWFLGLPTESIWIRFSNTPLTSWIPDDPAARAAYKLKLQQVIDGPLSRSGERIDFIYAQIKDAVYADPHKPMTNAEFDAAPQAVKAWIAARISSVQTQAAAP
jgi:spore coat protein CotH